MFPSFDEVNRRRKAKGKKPISQSQFERARRENVGSSDSLVMERMMDVISDTRGPSDYSPTCVPDTESSYGSAASGSDCGGGSSSGSSD